MFTTASLLEDAALWKLAGDLMTAMGDLQGAAHAYERARSLRRSAQQRLREDAPSEDSSRRNLKVA